MAKNTAAAARVAAKKNCREDGYALLAVLVAVFLVLLALSIAVPVVARSLRRDRELEAVHRANQYVRAIRLYYRKFGHYPGSLDQLEKSNNIRFLRQRYPDPFTGKPDWRIIKVGENKTTVKGFFGQPLAGVASAGLGSAAGMSSGIGPGSSAGTTGSGASSSSSVAGATSAGSTDSTGTGSTTPGSDTTAGNSAFGSSSGTSFGSSGSSFGSSSSSGSSTLGTGIGSQSATSFSGTGAPFLGVGLPTPGQSILTVNEKTTYPDWEFLYDPRIEQLRSKVNILGGGIASSGVSGLGSASSMSSPTGTSPAASTSTFGSPSSSSGSTGFGSTTTTPPQ